MSLGYHTVSYQHCNPHPFSSSSCSSSRQEVPNTKDSQNIWQKSVRMKPYCRISLRFSFRYLSPCIATDPSFPFVCPLSFFSTFPNRGSKPTLMHRTSTCTLAPASTSRQASFFSLSLATHTIAYHTYLKNLNNRTVCDVVRNSLLRKLGQKHSTFPLPIRDRKKQKNSPTLLRKESSTTWHTAQLLCKFLQVVRIVVCVLVPVWQVRRDPPYHKIRRERSRTRLVKGGGGS